MGIAPSDPSPPHVAPAAEPLQPIRQTPLHDRSELSQILQEDKLINVGKGLIHSMEDKMRSGITVRDRNENMARVLFNAALKSSELNYIKNPKEIAMHINEKIKTLTEAITRADQVRNETPSKPMFGQTNPTATYLPQPVRVASVDKSIRNERMQVEEEEDSESESSEDMEGSGEDEAGSDSSEEESSSEEEEEEEDVVMMILGSGTSGDESVDLAEEPVVAGLIQEAAVGDEEAPQESNQKDKDTLVEALQAADSLIDTILGGDSELSDVSMSEGDDAIEEQVHAYEEDQEEESEEESSESEIEAPSTRKMLFKGSAPASRSRRSQATPKTPGPKKQDSEVFTPAPSNMRRSSSRRSLAKKPTEEEEIPPVRSSSSRSASKRTRSIVKDNADADRRPSDVDLPVASAMPVQPEEFDLSHVITRSASKIQFSSQKPPRIPTSKVASDAREHIRSQVQSPEDPVKSPGPRELKRMKSAPHTQMKSIISVNRRMSERIRRDSPASSPVIRRTTDAIPVIESVKKGRSTNNSLSSAVFVEENKPVEQPEVVPPSVVEIIEEPKHVEQEKPLKKKKKARVSSPPRSIVTEASDYEDAVPETPARADIEAEKPAATSKKSSAKKKVSSSRRSSKRTNEIEAETSKENSPVKRLVGRKSFVEVIPETPQTPRPGSSPRKALSEFIKPNESILINGTRYAYVVETEESPINKLINMNPERACKENPSQIEELLAELPSKRKREPISYNENQLQNKANARSEPQVKRKRVDGTLVTKSGRRTSRTDYRE